MAGRDFSNELFGTSAPSGGRDFSNELFAEPVKRKVAPDIPSMGTMGNLSDFFPETNAQPPSVPDNRGMISRVGDFLRPGFKSVLEAPATSEQQQLNADRRLGYGVGPISPETEAAAIAARAGKEVTKNKTVNTVARALNAQGDPSFDDMIVRAKDVERLQEKPETESALSFGDEFVKGAKGAVQYALPSMARQIGLQGSAVAMMDNQKRLDLMDKIDSGIFSDLKELKKDPVYEAMRDNGSNLTLVNNYFANRNAPDVAAKMRGATTQEFRAMATDTRTHIDMLNQYAKENKEKYGPRVEKFTDINWTDPRVVADFTNWLGYNMGAGAVQMAPVMLAAVVAKQPGLLATSGAMGVSEAVGNRMKFIKDQVKGLPPEQQGDAIAKYVTDTKDTNLIAGLVSGSFDLFLGPAAKAAKVGLSKAIGDVGLKAALKTAAKELPKDIGGEAVTGALQEITQIAAKKNLGEEGKRITRENLKDIVNAAAAEGAGAPVGTAVNLGVGAVRNMRAQPQPTGRVEPSFQPDASVNQSLLPELGGRVEPVLQSAPAPIPPSTSERIEPSLDQAPPVREEVPGMVPESDLDIQEKVTPVTLRENPNEVPELTPEQATKAKWLKAINDQNRMQPEGGVQLTVTPEGKLNFMGNPGATKQGRALEATLNEAIKAGATVEEIAESINNAKQPATVTPESAAPVTPASYAADMAAGKKKTAPEDVQFYLNNAVAIEAELRKLLAKTETETSVPPPPPTAPVSQPAPTVGTTGTTEEGAGDIQPPQAAPIPPAAIPPPTKAAESIPETPTVPPAKTPKLFEPPVEQHAAVDFPAVPVPVADLKLSEDVPQFKAGATAKGVVEPLTGKFTAEGTAPIAVWRRLDGTMEVISGRHRFDLAQRSGTKVINAQVYDEAQGFTAADASILDAELNIRDEQGKVKDYVNYFKNSGTDKQTAESKGLLGRVKGKRGFAIANQGADALITALNGDQIGDEAAYYIALNAPNDERLQAVGLQAVMDGKSMNAAVNTMQAVKAMAAERDTTTDMFGFDDSLIKEAQEMAKIASKMQQSINSRLSAISGAAKNPAMAKAEGIDVRDPEAVKVRIDELKAQKAALENWSTSPELVAQIRAARGVEAPAFELKSETPEETVAREAAQENERRAAEEKTQADNEVDFFALQPQTQEKPEAPTVDMFADEAGPSAEYRAALELANRASAEFRKVQEAYRKQEIGDDDFLAGKKIHDDAISVYDKAVAKEQGRGEPAAIENEVTAPTETTTPAQREEAETHAQEVGGTLVWQEGDYALIRGYSLLSGDPVYVPTMGSSRARTDIASFTGKQIPEDVKQTMVEVKQRLEEEAAAKHAADPFIVFDRGMAFSPDMPEGLANVARGWKDLLKLKPNIYISTVAFAKENKDNFTGPHRRIGSAALDSNSRGSTRRMTDDSHYIVVSKSTSPTLMLEIIAHELGHIHEKEYFNQASPDVKEALKQAHAAWAKSQKGKSAKELVDSLRGRATARVMAIDPNAKADDLNSYWTSFGEWYADQISRWAVTSKSPVSVVEKFFKRLAIQLRSFYQRLRNAKYLPNETFAKYIEETTGKSVDLTPQDDRASQMATGNEDEQSGSVLNNIEQPKKPPDALTEDEVVGRAELRAEQIKEYAEMRARLARLPRIVAAGKVDLSVQAAVTRLMQETRDLNSMIRATKPRRDSAEKFLAKAATEFDNRNISEEVFQVIKAAYDKRPELLEGLLLSVKAPVGVFKQTAGQFLPFTRVVRLYKATSGATNPVTIRHELTHSLEQMMTPEQRMAVVQAWGKSLLAAIKKNPDEKYQKYFHAVMDFIDSPSEANFRKTQNLLPSYEMYQFINPSEYWAVNAEKLMASELGTAWGKFKRAIARLWEGVKSVFGFDNRYVVQKTFKNIMNGSKERITKDVLVDLVDRSDTKVQVLGNIEDDKKLVEKHNRPPTPQLDPSPTKTTLVNATKASKEYLKISFDDPMDALGTAANAIDRGVMYARNKNIWFGSGLNAADFAKYNGQLKTSQGLATASVALDNAIRGSQIGTEVIFQGGIKFDPVSLNFVATEKSQGMRGVYEAENEFKKKLGNQLGTDIIQGYLEAKRSRSIQNEFYDRQANLEVLKEQYEQMLESGAPEKEIKIAKDAFADARTEFQDIEIVFNKINMSDTEIDEFIARDKVHPELGKIMKNWSAINQNMLTFWRQVGLLSEKRYESLSNIKDYVPWQRIMNDETDIHSPIQATNRTMTNIGLERVFKKGTPTVITDFKATEGQQDFKVQPAKVMSVEVNGKTVDPANIESLPEGKVRLNVPIAKDDLVVFTASREIENIIDNMTRNVVRMTMNGLRQYAAQRIVSEYATRNAKNQVMTFPKVDLSKGRFSFITNGKRIVVEVQDPLIAESVIGMETLGIAMYKPLAIAANITRRAITLSGAFQIKQIFKDAPTAALVTGVKNPLLLMGGVYKGFVTSLLNTDPTVQILKSAGIGGFQSSARTPEAEIKRRIGIMNRNVFDFMIKGLDHIGDSSDMAQRVAVYKRVLAETGNETQALYQAANVINFLHHGSGQVAQFVVKTVPFAGAYANSIDVLAQGLAGGGLKGNSRAKNLQRLAVTGTLLTTMTLLYCMMVGDDEEYNQMDDQTKLRNFMIPGTKIMLPMNTSAAYFFKAIPEMLYNKVVKEGTANAVDERRLRTALKEAAIDMLLGPTPVPSAVKPFLEIGLNKDFFTGRPVVPDSVAKLDAAERYTAETSELGKRISALTGTDEKRLLDPIQADHIVRGIFGSAGAMAQWFSNSIGAAAGERVAPTDKQKPFVGPFLRDEVPRRNEDLFYKFKEIVDNKYGTYTKMVEREDFDAADKYLDKNSDLVESHDYITEVGTELKDINSMIRYYGEAKDTGLTPQERRKEIIDLQRLKQEVLDDVIDFRKNAGL